MSTLLTINAIDIDRKKKSEYKSRHAIYLLLSNQYMMPFRYSIRLLFYVSNFMKCHTQRGEKFKERDLFTSICCHDIFTCY